MKDLKALAYYCMGLLLLYGGIISGPVFAAIQLNIHGIIMEETCTINDSKAITVNFGDNLHLKRIDGVNYKQTVPYTVKCSGEQSDDMTLTLQGIGNGEDKSLLQTSEAGLAIRVFQNDVPLALNTAVAFRYPQLPQLQVVPVLVSNDINPGAFDATATLRVDYQ